MFRTIAQAGDRILTKLVPRATADAATCASWRCPSYDSYCNGYTQAFCYVCTSGESGIECLYA